MTYGESLADFYRRAAFYVDKIVQGARLARRRFGKNFVRDYRPIAKR
jgi:hypothetical protein